jgi:hypothetical protein
MQKIMKGLLGVSFLIVLSSCAELVTKPHYFSDNSQESMDVSEKYDRNYIQEYQAEDITVLIDKLPSGLKLKDGKLLAEEATGIKVLGEFALSLDMTEDPARNLGWSNMFHFANYRSPGAKAYCYPQVVLSFLTLTLWALVPTSYPCYGSLINSAEGLNNDMKNLATAAGGNLVVASFTMTKDNKSIRGARGFVVKVENKVNLNNPKSQKIF